MFAFMDHPTPFKAKSQKPRSKSTQKDSDAPKATKPKGPSNQREKRVFGRVHNPNIQAKPMAERTVKKPSSAVAKKPTITKRSSQKPTILKETRETEMTQKTPEESNSKPKKKSVSFSEIKDKIIEDVEGQTTPRRSPTVVKPRVSGTPYHSAGRCSKCRFDKLQTSSYWITQIKMADSVGKHFISAAFFRLAFLAQAEPIRNVRVELKRYLAQHQHLSNEKEWKDVSIDYGLVKGGNSSKEEQENSDLKADVQLVQVRGEEDTSNQQVIEESTSPQGLGEEFEIIKVDDADDGA